MFEAFYKEENCPIGFMIKGAAIFLSM